MIFYFPSYDDDPTDPNMPPEWLRYLRMTPLVAFINGYFWVIVFFIISGFVLPLRFFQTRKETCIYGGTFRRYLRLMIPVLVTLSLYYTVVHFGITSDKSFPKMKRRSFLYLIYDGLIGTWYGDTNYAVVTWTLSIELFASYIIYILAQTVVRY